MRSPREIIEFSVQWDRSYYKEGLLESLLREKVLVDHVGIIIEVI